MRLGIRRKLIGTLMLVGLFPLAMSLIVIVAGGAAMQLSRIRNNYEGIAANCADRIADTILRDELKPLTLIARSPTLIEYLRDQNRLRAAAGPTPTLPNSNIPAPIPSDDDLDHRWPSFTPDHPILQPILNNIIAKQLLRIDSLDTHHRELLVTNIYGQLIAADTKTNDFFQADEDWWQIAFNNGTGRVYVSSIIKSPTTGRPIIVLVLPIYDMTDPQHPLIGIIKDKINADWALDSLREFPGRIGASAQLVDLTTNATAFAPPEAQNVERAHEFYLKHLANTHVSIATLFLNDLIVGSSNVNLALRTPGIYPAITAPNWVVVVAEPSTVALQPVYHVATIVAGIGVVLILILFILGIAISNREIIMPILRLREATAAVGRGELNVRLLSDSHDPTFRKDELGDLARDFDEMTRQLQKNVNQLARSNEAKRRFMELAGHELRTPVTYLVGVCQLAQRQIEQLSSAATDGAPENAQTIASAERNAASSQTALAKIAAKTQRLSRIIDNLLKLVTNDQFTTRMNLAPVDVGELLLQITSDHRPFINERHQELLLDIAERLPPIQADRDKLEDAITNLVSNAIRFSPDGSAIRIAAHEVVGDMLEILVEDSGPGIPKGDLDNLFEPFFTGSDILHHHSGTIEFGSKGIGLGLAIVRRFIELHGGIVRAHTLIKPPQSPVHSPTGTQFQILLPLNRDQDQLAAIQPQSPPPSPDSP